MSTAEKNKLITITLAKKIASGMDVRQAWESLFGEGSWEKMTGQIYDELRARAAN